MKIIPVFVPHVGCPNDCVFCNQKKITGTDGTVINGSYVENIVTEYKKTIKNDVYTELAFFGGSFTAIDLELQKELLGAAKKFKDNGTINRIRCSTRPDAIDENILDIQKSYGMDIIELGIQSLNDDVLKLSNRGHTKVHSINASKMIKEKGFVLGHQIMPGLPGSSFETDIKTCTDSIKMKPDIVRIYPTLIIKDTDLLEMYEAGKYKPLTLHEAVDISALIYSYYAFNNINVIRIGLQNTENINKNMDVAAGPFHPAFRQLVEQNIFLQSLMMYFKGHDLKNKHITVYAPDAYISYLSGQNKANVNKLKHSFSLKGISFKSRDKNIIEIYGGDLCIGRFFVKDVYKNYLDMPRGKICI